MIEFDNATLTASIARGLLIGAFAARNSTIGLVGEVTGPVLVQLGDQDPIGPGSTAADEASFWHSTRDVTVQVVPAMGHDFNLHYENRASWKRIHDYLDARVGSSAVAAGG